MIISANGSIVVQLPMNAIRTSGCSCHQLGERENLARAIINVANCSQSICSVSNLNVLNT
jgi:hypothetical protein